jgi:phage major head subunit gpT-like protein
MMVRGAFNHLLRPGLRKDFRDAYAQYAEEYSSLLRVGSQDRAEIEAVTMAGLPQMIKRGETEPVAYMDPVMSDKFIFVDDEYALGFQVSRKLLEDDQYSKVRQNAKWLGRSARLTQEYLAAALFDDAFAGSLFTGLFNEPLIADDHALLNSAGTWSNRVAGDPQLGVTGLEAALELGELTVDQTGDPIPLQLDTIVCNVHDEWAAIQLTQNEKEPYTADNNINATRKKRQLSYVVSHYKSQTGRDWFIRDTQNHDAHFLFRVKPEFMDTFDFDTLTAKFMGRQRINVFFFDQRGWVGSNAT